MQRRQRLEFAQALEQWTVDDVSQVMFTDESMFCTRSSGRLLAVAERRDSKDYVSIVTCDTWSLAMNFVVGTEDLAGVSWAPNADIFCVWENPTVAFRLLLYSSEGLKLASYSLEDELVGIKSFSWSSCGQIVLLEDHNDKVTREFLSWLYFSCATD
ncbi:hypothetical protein HPB47_012095 [Ixodes persulcatus]|uniref:Uncharacterized protein n=1 Tax=Ixodes persulcatus TaxID=34615 RepID=A0AC60NUF8_IXOPE|nr:hypothetical protein HPB47_012095 [Ixodes persulcatus]